MPPFPPFLLYCSWHCLVSPLGRTCWALNVVCFSSVSFIFLYGHSMPIFFFLVWIILYFVFIIATFALETQSEISSSAWGIWLCVWETAEDKQKDGSYSCPRLSPSFSKLLTFLPSLALIAFCTVHFLNPLLEFLLNQQRDGKICVMTEIKWANKGFLQTLFCKEKLFLYNFRILCDSIESRKCQTLFGCSCMLCQDTLFSVQ